MVWSFGAAMDWENRKKFDAFFRKLTLGSFPEYPRPKIFRLGRNQLFPESGLVYDFMYGRNGDWKKWMDTVQHNEFVLYPDSRVSYNYEFEG